MAASYPTSAKSFTTKNNVTDTVDASHINDLQNEVTAVESDLLSATPTYITKVTTGINAAALSTGTVPLARLTSANSSANGVVDTDTQTFAGNKTFTGTLLANNGAKILVQGGIDGTSQRGIFLWSDTNWGLYLSQAGAGKSLANGTAATGIDGRSGWHVRFRSGQLTSEGFLWENQSETALMHLTADTGNLYLKGNVHVGNSTSAVVLHTESTTGINASALSTGTVPDARLSGSYTNVTALTSSNGTFTNVLTINAAVITGNLTANGANGSSGQVLTTNGSGLYWSTVTSGGGGETSNSTGGSGSIQYYNGTTFGSSSNLIFTGTTVFVGNSTANGIYGQQSLTLANSTSSATLNAGTLVLGTGSINSTSYTGTANNATYAFGKSENQLNVNSAITANNSTYAFGKSEGQLNVNSATQATNATNLNSQPASYYTNASNLTTGTLAIARLDANVILTTSTTGINASALSTGTVPNARLDSNIIYTTSTTGINASALSTGTVPNARLDSNIIYTTSTTGINASALSTGTVPNTRLDSNIIYTTSTTGINASALSTGTVPNARLDSNIIYTTSTTGINASALSVGTVPNARLSGSYTGITALTVSNTVTMARVIENFQTYANTISGTPTITFDCTTGNIWNLTGTISSNWTANFTNLGLTNSYSTGVTLVVNQGSTAYLPTAMQVESTAVTINWQAGTQPTPNASKKDIFAFSILQTNSNTYLVMGQLVSFG